MGENAEVDDPAVGYEQQLEKRKAYHEIEKERNAAFGRDGMVAFFDVLGYSDIAMNAAEDSIREVMGAVEAADRGARSMLDDIDTAGAESGEESRDVCFGSDFEDIKCVNISDSLVFHAQFQDPRMVGDDNGGFRKWLDADSLYRFVRFCRKVYCVLFEYGLPTRGAISIGTFYWNGANMLAGKPMIDAYRTSESLSFSGLVFGQKSSAEIHRRCHEMFESHYTHDTSFMRCGVDLPVKTGSGDGLEKLDLIMPELSDVRGVGFDSNFADQFATYGRDLGRSRTRAIIANTLRILHKYT